MLSSTPSNTATPHTSWSFRLTGLLAIIAGGALSAALAHAPTRPVMWLVAYLVLVVGIAQIALGAGQSRLAWRALSPALLTSQWLLFNCANGLVIAGRLLAQPAAIVAGAVMLAAALGLFLRGVSGAGRGRLLYTYRSLVVLLGCSALIGVGLSIWRVSA